MRLPCDPLLVNFGSIAQRIEQVVSTDKVEGSIPSTPTSSHRCLNATANSVDILANDVGYPGRVV